MIQTKRLKMFAFSMAAGFLLGGCSSGHEPMEVYTSVQEESQKTTESIKVMPGPPQEGQGTGTGEEDKPQAGGTSAQGGRIEEQTFDVALRPLGQVTFASYWPDTSRDALADVVFRIEKEGQVLSQLPGMWEDNIGHELFNQVEAVSFTDYNNDGYDDIITIVSYYPEAGPQTAVPHSLIRYYKGTADGTFVYEQEMSNDASSAFAEITIQAAKDFIGPKRAGTGDGTVGSGGKAGSLEPWQEALIQYLDHDSAVWQQQGYTLIHMDDDGIPELVEVGGDEATGCRIVYYGKGKVQVVQLNRLYFDYIPGGNLLRNGEGLMDYYYDLIYSIVDGEMELVAAGYYGAEDNSNVQFDAQGNPVYQYEWEGVKMGREEYERELSKVYDASKAVTYDYNNLYSAEDIRKLIEGYQAS